jgi:hypothetical protein
MGKLLLSVVVICAGLLTSCGSGGAIGGGGGQNQPTLTALQVSPTNPSIAAGFTQKFTAQGTFSDGSTRDMTASVSWASSDSKVATVNVSATPGLAKGIAPGSSMISASSGGVSGNTTLAVGNAVLNSIAVTPAAISIPLGLQEQLNATGTFSDGSIKDLTLGANWTSSNPAVLAVSSTGDLTTSAVGSAMITATSSGVSGIANVTVGPAQLVSISVTPANPVVAAGASEQFTATGTFTDGTNQDLTASANWSSSAQFIAPPPIQGSTQTQTAGTATITAAASGISGSTLLTATQSRSQPGVHIKLRANINPTPGLDNYSDVVGETRSNGKSYAYLASWHNTSGVQIFDVTNPDAPTLIATYAPAGTSDNMQGVQVANGVGFFSSDSNGGGVHIVDLSNPASPALITRILPTQQGRFSDNVHDITIDGPGQHLYIPGYPNDDTIQVWNVSNPFSPVFVRTFNGSDPIAVHDVTVSGNRLFAAGWGDPTTNSESSDIFDITNIDTQNPQLLGSFTSGLHTQDVSVSTDGNFLFCPHELASHGDVAVFDISNPGAVTPVTDIQEDVLGLQATSPSTSKLMGNFLYVAWYQAGLAVFDVSDPANPMLVGNYDTWPGVSTGGNGGGNGDWGIWPFLGTDKVLIGDRTTGLYVVDTRAVSSQPAVFSIAFSPNPVVGGSNVTGTVFLVGIAPAGGVNIVITTNNSGAPGQTVTIPAGATSSNFTQITPSVSVNTNVTVTATDGIFSVSGILRVTP